MTDYKDYNKDEYPNIPDAISEITVSEFGGEFPEVPLADGVNLAELTESDGNPFFITLPIAEVDWVSKNKLRYTREFCESLVEQINTDKPMGIRGHIKDSDRGSAYPEPAVYWLGARLDNDKVWAKGYIPPGATREEYRIKKATKAQAATSIYGRPIQIQDHRDGTYTPKLSLEQVDLAPPKRAAHGKGYAFAVTRELEEVEETMEKTIKEMTADELVAAIDPKVVQQIVEMQRRDEKPVENPAIAEMQADVTAKAQVIAELEKTVETQKSELGILRTRVVTGAVTAEIEKATDWNVKSDEGQKKLGTLRDMLKKQVIAELAEDISDDAVKAAVEKAMTDQQFVVEMTREALGGPNARAGAVDNRVPTTAVREISDEEARAKADALGLL